MDIQPYIIWGLGAASAIFSFFSRVLWKKSEANEKELALYKLHVSEHYVKYDKLRDYMEPIMDALNEIKETLKTKADK